MLTLRVTIPDPSPQPPVSASAVPANDEPPNPRRRYWPYRREGRHASVARRKIRLPPRRALLHRVRTALGIRLCRSCAVRAMGRAAGSVLRLLSHGTSPAFDPRRSHDGSWDGIASATME